MNEYIEMALGFVSSADVYLLAISGVLVALLGVAKLTKTKKDDKVLAKAIAFIAKIASYLPKSKLSNDKKKKISNV